MVYYRDSPNAQSIKVLPTAIYLGGQVLLTIDYVFRVGFIRVFHLPPQSNPAQGMDNLLPNSQMRFVIIPAEVLAGSRLSSSISSMDYLEVCEWLGLSP